MIRPLFHSGVSRCFRVIAATLCARSFKCYRWEIEESGKCFHKSGEYMTATCFQNVRKKLCAIFVCSVIGTWSGCLISWDCGLSMLPIKHIEQMIYSVQ